VGTRAAFVRGADDGPVVGSPRPRLLIVDDDPVALEHLGQLLEEDGYVCERAESGAEALAAAKARAFDDVVSDVKMDGMSGLDLLDCHTETQPSLPVTTEARRRAPPAAGNRADSGARS
jgi:CheY-like chemotaxis protein